MYVKDKCSAVDSVAVIEGKSKNNALVFTVIGDFIRTIRFAVYNLDVFIGEFLFTGTGAHVTVVAVDTHRFGLPQNVVWICGKVDASPVTTD